MRFISLLLILLSVFALASALKVQRTTIADVQGDPSYFKFVKSARLEEIVQFKILLKQKNLESLEKKFWDVSSPKSENYGKYLTAEEIDSIVAPSQSDVKVVTNWLLNNKVSKNEMIVHSDYIQVRINVNKASNLFETAFARYSSVNTGRSRVRVSGPASIPTHVHEKIDFITGLSDFIEDNKMTQSMRTTQRDLSLTSAVSITPQVIKQFYGIPSDLIATNEQNYQSIAAFTDYYSEQALSFFDKKYGIENVRVTAMGQNCISQGCDQDESDLDVQYMTAIGNNVTTLFLSSGNGEWVLDWATAIQKVDPVPKISSISYGWAEIEQCQITTGCQTLGIDSAAYVQRTNTEFQKLGLLGMTVFVSSGDDGAPSFGDASGNCPIDTKNYCPLGGCQHTTTQCPGFTIAESNGTFCYFPMGLGSQSCAGALNNQEYVNTVNKFLQANEKKCHLAIEKDSQQNQHFYSSCTCDQLEPLTNEEAGFKVNGYSYEQDGGDLFAPDYPASSPYITSVGATQILAMNKPEVVCSVSTGAIITSGGGFAKTQSQPSYQAAAVAKYLQTASNLPPSYSYTASNRAYPDITLAGHNYNIGLPTNQGSSNCPCEIGAVDGTSCSSPTLAGIMSLINDKLLSAGKPTLGFLNPLLYQAAQEQPNVFNDITVGNNNCNHAYCCEYGFPAASGYDAASGLGSVSYSNLESYILNLNNL